MWVYLPACQYPIKHPIAAINNHIIATLIEEKFFISLLIKAV
jgi:hypothetical protein